MPLAWTDAAGQLSGWQHAVDRKRRLTSCSVASAEGTQRKGKYRRSNGTYRHRGPRGSRYYGNDRTEINSAGSVSFIRLAADRATYIILQITRLLLGHWAESNCADVPSERVRFEIYPTLCLGPISYRSHGLRSPYTPHMAPSLRIGRDLAAVASAPFSEYLGRVDQFFLG